MAPRVVLLPEDLASTVHEIGREKETDLDLLLYKRIRNHCSNTQLTLLFDVVCMDDTLEHLQASKYSTFDILLL